MSLIKNLALSIGILSLSATGVQTMASSSTLLTYDGTGIWNWRSVSDFSISEDNTTVTVNHNQIKNLNIIIKRNI